MTESFSAVDPLLDSIENISKEHFLNGIEQFSSSPIERDDIIHSSKSLDPDKTENAGKTAYELSIIKWLVLRVNLDGFFSDRHWLAHHDEIALEFAMKQSPQHLFLAMVNDVLVASLTANTLIHGSSAIISYFVKQVDGQLTLEDINEHVQFGTVSGHSVNSLLRLMMGIYGPKLVKSVSAAKHGGQLQIPESVGNEVMSHYYKFVTSLVEVSNHIEGKTVLYLPLEIGEVIQCDEVDLNEITRNKDLVRNLESIVIQWTRQIKDVISNYDSALDGETKGPLEEVQFWKSRSSDLSDMSKQLLQKDVMALVKVLGYANSSYLGSFLALSERIKEGSIEANDNLKFLNTIVDPCTAVALAFAADIPVLLPNLLNCIRIIAFHSTFYNTPERLTGLLRKISNQIIQRCHASICLSEIYSGNVDLAVKAINEIKSCIWQWKNLYRKTAKLISICTPDTARHWTFDDASLFAPMDAFSQRCSDILVVCEGQIQFSRRNSVSNGQPMKLPEFGGTYGQEIKKALEGIASAFDVQIVKLRELEYDILDVKIGSWHDDFAAFFNVVKDLEVMYKNVINSAFEGVNRVADSVALLEMFYSLASRSQIVHACLKKTAHVYMQFISYIGTLRKEFDEKRRNPPLGFNEPKFSGSALWANSILKLADNTWNLVRNCIYFPKAVERIEAENNSISNFNLNFVMDAAKEAEKAHSALIQILSDYKATQYQAWIDCLTSYTEGNSKLELGSGPKKEASKLGLALLRRARPEDVESSGGTMVLGLHLVCNFDAELLALFAEVSYWEKLHGEFSVPYAAQDLCGNREMLRSLREHVMLIIRAYNSILADLTLSERRLFSDHLRRLDRRINQGTTNLTWASKGIVEFFVKDCCAFCEETHAIIKAVHASQDNISKGCRSFAQMQLFAPVQNRIYDSTTFVACQTEHCSEMRLKLKKIEEEILKDVREIYSNFKDGTPDVKREWRSFITQTDRNMETSLRQAVKKSAQELNKAVNGDAKTEPQTLFRVSIILEKMQLDYKPNIATLSCTLDKVTKELIGTVKAVSRLSESLPDAEGEGRSKVELKVSPSSSTQIGSEFEENIPSFYTLISNDDDTLKVVMQIMNGMSSSAVELEKYTSYWLKYKHIWENDKDGFIRFYSNANNNLAQFDADISRYRDLQVEIQGEEVSHSINFIKVDCSLAKVSLVNHAMQWQSKLTTLLNRNAIDRLAEMHRLFSETTSTLMSPPTSLTQLSQNLAYLEQTKQGDIKNMQEKMIEIEEMYGLLSKFEVMVTEEETNKVTSLRPAWDSFRTMLVEAEGILEKGKSKMKFDVENCVEAYNASIISLCNEASSNLPYAVNENASISLASCAAVALKSIADYRSKCLEVHNTQSELQTGLSMFRMDEPRHNEFVELECELDMLEKIWIVVRNWEETLEKWKSCAFEHLNVEQMDFEASEFNKSVVLLGRDMKKWKVWRTIKEKIQTFMKTLPLIQDLKNPSFRERHWHDICTEIGKYFSTSDPNFTLESVFLLGLPLQADIISVISANANQEVQIEKALASFEDRWGTINLEVTKYKDAYLSLKSTEDLFQVLEEDSMQLGSIKSSRFYKSFSIIADQWDVTFNVIGEVVEAILGIQRKWMYLENIFMASEDICIQLPTETSLFLQVNKNFVDTMEKMRIDSNAVVACKRPGLLESIVHMDAQLEVIQKSLEQYLETKRMIFPRFYFISNDDLLEILGQSKDPAILQKHLKKCFEGIKRLTLETVEKSSKKLLEATSIIAPDGETLNLEAPLPLSGPIEVWMDLLLQRMQLSLQKQLNLSISACKGKKEKWIKDYQGQALITTGAIKWTSDCTKALELLATGEKHALLRLRKKQIGYLNKLSDMIRGPLGGCDREKLVALITMEIHNRDVMEKMMKNKCTSTEDFEWLSQLRFVFDESIGQYGMCKVYQTNCQLEYSYEYQGNNGRLVVTPLTDRCVLTLTTAMFLHRGGNPLGPAGTGKTETVKDLGKNLGKYVVVINCSDGMDYKSVGQIFSGLVQSGSWGCFDEFNRIKIEVLSVVAMQVSSIVNALSLKAKSFVFMGSTIACNSATGIFITMNPGYAGRTELPDNLKALMRPVAMMTPDLAIIAEVMLAAEGFREGRELAQKLVTLYTLMMQQLSKQDHYDYGLRSIKSVLNMAGKLKRADPNVSEKLILMNALRDINLPKFLPDDEHLFKLLLSDLFPQLEIPTAAQNEIQISVISELKSKNLEAHPYLCEKIMQLYNSKMTRHCNMLVGQTLSGKSTAWKTLAEAKSFLHMKGNSTQLPVTVHIINPKSVTLSELYGEYDLATFDWSDGILSTIFKTCEQDTRQMENWIVMDGPVDALWIESMNSVMDDNKILTLINGDRVPLNATTSLVFETGDLAVASPATVSRAGMIYMDSEEIGWKPFVTSWISKKFQKGMEEVRDFHIELFEKYVRPVLKFKQEKCIEPVPLSDFCAVRGLIGLYDSLDSNIKDKLSGDHHAQFNTIEKWFLLALIWSICSAVDEKGRILLDGFIRDIDTQFPPVGTIYDYFVDTTKNDWDSWETRVPLFRYHKDMSFHAMIVPTIDTVRNGYILNTLIKGGVHALLVGNSGCGKTVLAKTELSQLSGTYGQLVINFSATTDSRSTQNMIESAMEKKSKDKMGPVGGKKLICFIDDFNMPARTSLESPYQPPLELLQFWMDHGGWYDRKKCSWRSILGMQLLCAMAPPGGARSSLNPRTQSRFNILNLTSPSYSQAVRIFESILTPRLSDFELEVRSMGNSVASACLKLYKSCCDIFLPTPQKSHYLFSLRDVGKVVEGITRVGPESVDSKDALIRLWCHESQRVYGDRLLMDQTDDPSRFKEVLNQELKASFGTTWDMLLNGKSESIFTGVLSKSTDSNSSILEVKDLKYLKEGLEEKLEDYNSEPKLVSIPLVLFKDALLHITRIHRVLSLSRGSIMLVGVGSSGRQSLTRLAAYIAGYSLFYLDITKSYRTYEFREDLKRIFAVAGIQAKPVTFFFSDNQINDESFLEDLNNILQTGEVPGLYTKDELVLVLESIRKSATDSGRENSLDDLWKFFVQRVRDNLHIALAMSPVGDGLRNRLKKFPAFVSCTTIDWFQTWPEDALIDVAQKLLHNIQLDDESQQPKIATIFSAIHGSVIDLSTKMQIESKRYNYVTPSNYLELVNGYRTVLNQQRGGLNTNCSKLRNGLDKLEQAREQVELMSIDLEKQKIIVAAAQKDCESLLVEIVSKRRAADERKKQVEIEAEHIGKEEAECSAIAQEAQADLAVAMPALEQALIEVDKLDKSAITEVKAYTKPPSLVETVLSAVMILFGKPTDWMTAKQVLGKSDFLQSIKSYDKDNIGTSTMNKIRKYVSDTNFTPESVSKVSGAASALCIWVHAVYLYATVANNVAPKRARLKDAEEKLAQKRAGLHASRTAQAEIVARVESLRQKYELSVSEKNRIMEESQWLAEKLERANKLVTGLSAEYIRWQVSISKLEGRMNQVAGDSLLAAAFLSYAGPFDARYRSLLVQKWSTFVQHHGIQFTSPFSFTEFLMQPTQVRAWNIQGLPRDDFSAENAVMVTTSRRWPLMIDPQSQANKWIRAMEGDSLKVVDLVSKDFLFKLSGCVTFGYPCLLQDVREELDPSLDPVLCKAIIKQGSRETIRLGNKEIDWSSQFRLYITTKLANPHYPPEISSKTVVINFGVKQEGLEAQLLGIVVQQERPSLEEESSKLIVDIAAGSKKLADIEDSILKLLSESHGSLLDDHDLVNALQQSKITSEEVAEGLRSAHETSVEINAAREGYRAAAVRASITFFVLKDLAMVDPMYQFSLDTYIDLFNKSLRLSKDGMAAVGNFKRPKAAGTFRRESIAISSSNDIEERCIRINMHHTLAVYYYACRGLFERHKLLFSFHLCLRIMMSNDKIPAEEYNFLLRGAIASGDITSKHINKCKDWLSDSVWSSVCELDRLSQSFNGLRSSIEQASKDWRDWFFSVEPENSPLPMEWDLKCTQLQKLCVLRALRTDRMLNGVVGFVGKNLGSMYIDLPPFNLQTIYNDSSSETPFMFILSPGVDPTVQVESLAQVMNVRIDMVALGQGQAPVALELLKTGSREGYWVFLANCHLMLSWMPELENVVMGMLKGANLHPNFRLWLSSAPHPTFPISILQRSIKITTEPPSGIRANMSKLYQTITEEKFDECMQKETYKKLLFSLCWFHAILLERRKFKSLGFNSQYDFNDGDFSICHDLLIVFLDKYPTKTPFDAICYLIAEANYGGRVTDEWDRRLVNVYIRQFICESSLAEPYYKLSSLDEYHIPVTGDLTSYKSFVLGFPKSDRPEIFGQHPNADIVSLIEDTESLFGTLASLQPQVSFSAGSEKSHDDSMVKILDDLQAQLPEIIDMKQIVESIHSRNDPDSLKTFFLQESNRYATLLKKIHIDLSSICLAIKGLIVVTLELEHAMSNLAAFNIPRGWNTCYLSLKPLGSWVKDLSARVKQIKKWAFNSMPKCVWFSGLTFPTGFLTALLQISARKNGIAIDTLSWEFIVMNVPIDDIPVGPKEGAYCSGLYLEGASWNKSGGCLVEPEPMQLYCEMPVVHFKPVENKKTMKSIYLCPIYMYPIRTGTRERPSFVIAVELKMGKNSSEFWTKRGVAMLLSLAL